MAALLRRSPFHFTPALRARAFAAIGNRAKHTLPKLPYDYDVSQACCTTVLSLYTILEDETFDISVLDESNTPHSSSASLSHPFAQLISA